MSKKGAKPVTSVPEEPAGFRSRLARAFGSDSFFYRHDGKGVFTYVSPSVRGVLGYAVKDFLRHYTRYLTPDPRNEEARRRTVLSLKGKKQKPYLLEVFHARGGTRWLEALEVPVKDQRGKVAGVEGVARDVTARVNAEKELEEKKRGLEAEVTERTRQLAAGHAALKKNWANLEGLLNNTSDLIWSVDRGLKFITFNEAYRKICESRLSRRVKPGDPVLANALAPDVHKWKKRYSRALSGQSFREEDSYVRSGRRHYYDLTFGPILLDGKIIGAACSGRDITARRRMEEELRRGSAQLNAIFNNSPMIMLLVNKDRRITRISLSGVPNKAANIGRMAGEALGCEAAKSGLCGKEKECANCPLRELLSETFRSRKAISRREIGLTIDNEQVCFVASTAVITEEGEPQVLICLDDVTRLKKAELALKKQNEVLEAQNITLMTLGRSRKAAGQGLDAAFREAAEICAHALGVDRVGVWLFTEDKTAMVCRDVYDAPTRRHFSGERWERAKSPLYFKVIESEGAVAAADARRDPRTAEFSREYFIPNGILSVLDMQIVAEGRPAGIVCAENAREPREWSAADRNLISAVCDYSALAILEERRVQLERSKDLLAHAIVHDLNNPMTALLCSCEFLEDELKGTMSEAQHERFKDIYYVLNEMREMINDILRISKMEAGSMQLDIKPVPVRDIIGGAIKTMLPRAQAERKSLKAGAAPARVVKADREMVGRVLQNLINNALKFSPSSGRVGVKAESGEGGAEVLFSVSDAGPGIPEEYIGKIFDKFFQGPTAAAARGGMGLGLTFCRMVICAHGGRIWAENCPGGGSVFRFTLPLN
ncbi:MAG: two-component sensor histidine kinase [Elusimicrobia bacterium]|nr:MAG: two-component sensor histidine kinase [Elusimicrobiota bacterium]KAF0155242.1 MAG: two-component sensor histidine kinase [Elusimicrobiota bacterium]